MTTVKVSNPAWQNNLLCELASLYQSGILCDVCIEGSDGETVAAHACVLAAASPVMRDLLRENDVTVKMHKISSEVWMMILEFVYTGKVSFSTQVILVIEKVLDFCKSLG